MYKLCRLKKKSNSLRLKKKKSLREQDFVKTCTGFCTNRCRVPVGDKRTDWSQWVCLTGFVCSLNKRTGPCTRRWTAWLKTSGQCCHWCLLVYWRLVAPPTAQGHLRAVHKFKSCTCHLKKHLTLKKPTTIHKNNQAWTCWYLWPFSPIYQYQFTKTCKKSSTNCTIPYHAIVYCTVLRLVHINILYVCL